MNYGSIAYLNEGKLFIPEYLLRPFNIDNNTNLTLLAYSTPNPEFEKHELKKIGYNNLPKKHDIIITPIAFRLWPFLVRAKILLQERNGAIASVSEYLAQNNMNILSADCHRAGFRYMVFSCILECADIRDKFINISKKGKWKTLSELVKERVKLLSKEMIPFNLRDLKKNEQILKPFTNSKKKNEAYIFEMRRFLYIPTKQEKKNGMLTVIAKSSTLPFHFLQILKGKSQNNRSAHYSKYNGGSITLPEEFLAELKRNHNIDFSSKISSPTFGFVNVDTKAPRIRVTLTPKFEINNYRRIIIDYRRDSLEYRTSVGFVSIISSRLSTKFNLCLENLVNRIWLNERKKELGKVEFIAEKNCKDNTIWKKVEKDIKKTILKHNEEFHHTKTIVKCTPINPYKFFISLKTSDKQFVKNTKKLLYRAGKNFGISKNDFKFVWTHSSPVTESVISALKECNALVQIYYNPMNKEEDFIWLDGEFLAMRALSKPCARICSNSIFNNTDFSKFDKDITPYLVNFSHGNKRISKKYSVLLNELINRIEENEPNALNRFK